MRTLYDAVTATDIPADARMVAGYVDGAYAWTAANWARFPLARKVRITVGFRYSSAPVLDVERGDATPDQAVEWAQFRRNRGLRSTVYCNAATWPQVRAAFAAAQEPEPLYWIADWGIPPVIPAGAIALQYHHTPGYDLSVVAGYWPGVDPAPAPAPADPAAPTAGYVLVDTDGAVYAFGTARVYGDLRGHSLDKPPVGIAVRPQGDGYWIAAADGGVFTFGAAPFHGSMGGQPLNKPVVGIAAAPDGNGYTLFAADGGVFTFGSAAFAGAEPPHPVAPSIVGGAVWPPGA